MHITKQHTTALTVFLMMLGILGVSLAFPEKTSVLILKINYWIFTYFSEWFLWVGLIALFVVLIMVIVPFGKIRLGGDNAKPECNLFNWVSMLFCAGMGVGMLLWGGAEPLFNMTQPISTAGALNPLLAAKEALAFSYFHWGLHPWALYTISSIAMGFYVFNRNSHMTFDAVMLPPVIQRLPLLNKGMPLIHFIVLLTFTGGVAVSFSIGALQLENGIAHLFTGKSANAWPAWSHILVVGGCFVAYMISTLGGLGAGIKYLSQIGVGLSLVLWVWVIIKGWPMLEVSTFIESMGYYLQNIVPMSLAKIDYVDADWPRLWTVKIWAWWLTWAPFMGMFGALISRGRTLREITLGMTLIPAAGSFLWFWVMGEVAIKLQATQQFMGATPSWDQMPSVLYKTLAVLDSPVAIVVMTVIVVALFFVNSADSATYSLATLGDDSLIEAGEVPKPPKKSMQFLWGSALAILALAMLLLGGIQFLQDLILVLVFPYLFLYIFMMGRLVYDMMKSIKRKV